MSRRFRAGSIRRQIAALAIGPITALVTLNAISEWALREDLESVSYAKATALTMETIINQVRASTSIEQEAAILETTSKTGLGVEEVAAEELLKGDAEVSLKDVRHLVQVNLPADFATAFREETSGGVLRDVLVVGIGNDKALAFLPASPPSCRLDKRPASQCRAATDRSCAASDSPVTLCCTGDCGSSP
ncbi:hypothetical protein ACQZ6E_24845 [Agrobacterium vitis]|uniref:hypothetical protein n=1 Tax=Agrobacterium vitis TaxID=373 RepID=UPI0018D26D2E|nr:hypothetical protein [Agrobacterium vitis]